MPAQVYLLCVVGDIRLELTDCGSVLASCTKAGQRQCKAHWVAYLVTIESCHNQGIGPHFLVQPEKDGQAKCQGGHAAISFIDGFWKTPIALPGSDEVNNNTHRCKRGVVTSYSSKQKC